MVKHALFIAASAVGTCFAAFAQQTADQERDMATFRSLIEQEAQDLSVNNPKDSDIISLVERIMMVRLAQTLDLTVEETQDLGTRVGQCRSRVYNLKWLRADLRQSLREAVEAGEDVEVEEKLEKLLKLDITIAQLIEEMIEDSREDLTVEQAARFYLFIEDFERDLSRMIEKARELTREKAGDGDAETGAPEADSSGL